MADAPSITQQFAEWVRTKPADEEYDFYRVGGEECGCAVTQFVTAQGLDSLSDGYPLWVKIHAPLDGALRLEPHTFGALAGRLDVALARGEGVSA